MILLIGWWLIVGGYRWNTSNFPLPISDFLLQNRLVRAEGKVEVDGHIITGSHRT